MSFAQPINANIPSERAICHKLGLLAERRHGLHDGRQDRLRGGRHEYAHISVRNGRFEGVFALSPDY